MLLEVERELLVAHTRRLAADRLVVGTSGNLSMRVGELVAITPSGVDYDALAPALICVVDRAGTPVEMSAPASSELPMHLAVYDRVDARAVVHTHSTFATVLSTLVQELPPVHYLIALFGGPVLVAPYATYGSAALAEHAATALQECSGALLANHGAITIGRSLEQAYARSVYLEWLCEVYAHARQLGEPALLPPDEIARVGQQLQTYGQERHAAQREEPNDAAI